MRLCSELKMYFQIITGPTKSKILGYFKNEIIRVSRGFNPDPPPGLCAGPTGKGSLLRLQPLLIVCKSKNIKLQNVCLDHYSYSKKKC